MGFKERLRAKKMKKAGMAVEAVNTNDGAGPTTSTPENNCPSYTTLPYPAGKEKCFDLVMEAVRVILKHLGAIEMFRDEMAHRIGLRAATRYVLKSLGKH